MIMQPESDSEEERKFAQELGQERIFGQPVAAGAGAGAGARRGNTKASIAESVRTSIKGGAPATLRPTIAFKSSGEDEEIEGEEAPE